MPTISKTIDVDVPVEVAYDQWTRFEDFPHFMDGVKEVTQLDDTTVRWTAEIGGHEETWEAKITDQTPHERIAWTSVGETGTAGLVSFEPIDARRSRVEVRFDWDAEGLLETLGGMLGADDRRVEGDLERFKELVERRGAIDGWHGKIEAGRVERDDRS